MSLNFTKVASGANQRLGRVAEVGQYLEKAQDIYRRVRSDDSVSDRLGQQTSTLAVMPKEGQSKDEFIEDYIDMELDKVPYRLLDLKQNKLIKRTDLAYILKQAKNEYAQIMEVDAKENWSSIILKGIEPHLRYAIFSHRWGADEPIFEQVEDHRFSELCEAGEEQPKAGFRKLASFCEKARASGFNLAWSDTCCIDKRSSAEVQEAINSMFRWYSQSSLCIAHMAETKSRDVIKQSNKWEDEWFKRGWTLQELLAPKTLKFYMQNWDVLVPVSADDPASQNDKENGEVLKSLEKVTGIKEALIRTFVPGSTDLQDKMIWAAHRKTTRPEDIAYCLLGIFSVHLDINYGEGAEEAFYRLQKQIIEKTRDSGIFIWHGKPSSHCSMIASHPRYYALQGGTQKDVRDMLEPYNVHQRSMFTKIMCLCGGIPCWYTCLHCAVRVEVLIDVGEIISRAESHFTITNNGLQIKADTIRVTKWRLPHATASDGKTKLYRWRLHLLGHQRIKIAFRSDMMEEIVRKTREVRNDLMLLPLTEEAAYEGGKCSPRLAVLLYKVAQGTWERIRTEEPIILKRDKFQALDSLHHTFYIR